MCVCCCEIILINYVFCTCRFWRNYFMCLIMSRFDNCFEQRRSREHKARGQGQLFQGLTFSRTRTWMLEPRPRTQAQVFSKTKFFRRSQKKRSSKIFFRRSPNEENKNSLQKFSARFLAFSYKIFTVQKIVLSLSGGQGNFREPEASRSRPRIWPTTPSSRTSKLDDSTSGFVYSTDFSVT